MHSNLLVRTGAAWPDLAVLQLLRGPAVPSPGDTAQIGNEEVADHRNLSMTGFIAFQMDGIGPTQAPLNPGHYYGYLRGIWKDGAPLTTGGDGRDPQAATTKFMWSGNPPGYWSEMDTDNAGTASTPRYKSVVASSGPFDMTGGGEQELTYAVVWANGATSLDALAELRAAAVTVTDAFGADGYPDPDFIRQPVNAVVPDQVFVDAIAGQDTTIAIRIENAGGGYLRWSAAGEFDPPFTNFLVTQNAAGPLDPPEYGAFDLNGSDFPHPTTDGVPTAGRQQANSDAVWGIHTGGSAVSFEDFVSRSRASALLGRDDYEIRFTSQGGMGIRLFDDDALMTVPFELWRIGLASLNDPSDDVRLVPVICDQR